MHTYICLLRGINVSGQKMIRMEELRGSFEALGLKNVATYLQSGNVVFRSGEGNVSALTGRIEMQIETTFGFGVRVFIRDGESFQRLLIVNPFLKNEAIDPAKLHVTFLCEDDDAAVLSSVESPNNDGDEFIHLRNEIFLHCPNGYGRTKFSNTFFEKKLKTHATTRNWKTVQALCELSK
jgi:uncharacterized protein (DUF1697 family)